MNGLIILKWTDTKTVHFLYDRYREFKKKNVIALRKPTYYLWRNDFSSQEEFEAERKKYADIGFRVVTFLDGNSNTNIHDGIKALIKITGIKNLIYINCLVNYFKLLTKNPCLSIEFNFCFFKFFCKEFFMDCSPVCKTSVSFTFLVGMRF